MSCYKKYMIAVFLVLFLALSASASFPFKSAQAQESNGSISFQPSEMSNIGFSYNSEEYRFELTWKSYYLNIKPFAIYNGQYYDLKQIIPWLKNNYPNINYRTAIQKFKKYHRWGFWLEKLPQDVADNLDFLGFDISDNNIPLSSVEIEKIADYNFTFKRIHIADRFSFDFYDLYEQGFDVSINKTTILIGKVKGLTDLDLDPITYAAPIITVTGFTEGTPCTFWDVWNASNVNGWNVVHNNNNSGRQYQFEARLLIGDGSIATTFTDYDVQIFFNRTRNATGQWCIYIHNNAIATFGQCWNVTEKRTYSGVHFFSDESTGAYYGTLLYPGGGSTVNLYSCSFGGSGAEQGVFGSRVWNCELDHAAYLYGVNLDSDIYNVIVSGSYGYRFPYATHNIERLSITATGNALWLQGNHGVTVKNSYISDLPSASEVIKVENTLAQNHYFIDITWKDDWTLSFTGVNTGKLYRQNTFNVVVVDNLGTAINGANVTLFNDDGSNAFTALTHANGSITEQTVSRGFYNQTGGNTLYDYGPFNLTITATGYQEQELENITLAEAVDWTYSLKDANDPTASFNFTPSNPIHNQTVSFDGTGSTDTDGTISTYSWDFGDTGTSSTSTPTHTYTAIGTYTVNLTVTDSQGLTDSETQNIIVGTDYHGVWSVSETDGLSIGTILEKKGPTIPQFVMNKYQPELTLSIQEPERPEQITVSISVMENGKIVHTHDDTFLVNQQTTNKTYSLDLYFSRGIIDIKRENLKFDVELAVTTYGHQPIINTFFLLVNPTHAILRSVIIIAATVYILFKGYDILTTEEE